MRLGERNGTYAADYKLQIAARKAYAMVVLYPVIQVSSAITLPISAKLTCIERTSTGRALDQTIFPM